MKKYFQAPWRKKDIFVILISTILLLFFALFGIKYSGIQEYSDNEMYSSFVILMLFLLQSIITLGPLIYLTSKKHSLHLSTFGINKLSIRKTIKSVFGGVFLYLSVMFIITSIILYTDTQIPGFKPQEPLLPMFGDDLRSITTAGVMAILFAPFVEEIFFRGFLLRSFSNMWGILVGSILSAGIFAVAHGQFQNILPIFILGLIINRMVIRTNSIIPAIAFHMINNGIALTVEILILNGTIPLESIA